MRDYELCAMRINLNNLFIGNPCYAERRYAYDWEHLKETFASIVKPSMTVVEVGSSNFQKTLELSGYCKNLIGIEIDKDKIFAPLNNIEVINADWQDLSSVLESNSIDIVISSHVIEHVQDDLRAINETYEVLKNGGSLLFLTPNRGRLSRRLAKILRMEEQCTYKEHKREYTDSDIRDLISRSKFKNYTIKGFVLGLHSGNFMFFLKRCPWGFKKLVNFWEVHLIK